jgi:uncharacterized protein
MRYIDDGTNVVISLGPKDSWLEGIMEVVGKLGIDTAAITVGLGSMSKARIHTVSSNDYPVSNEYIDIPGPVEVASLQGIIANGKPHIHVSLMDWKNGVKTYYGGHLEEGCVALTLAEIVMTRMPNMKLERAPLLQARED